VTDEHVRRRSQWAPEIDQDFTERAGSRSERSAARDGMDDDRALPQMKRGDEKRRT
jgi:hypothetical protein